MMKDPIREYEGARFPPDRRLDLHGEGPRVARDRTLRWIQSRAHEHPGQELLLIVERGRSFRRPSSPVATAVHDLLDELTGRLVEWWKPFAPGSILVRVADDPRMERRPAIVSAAPVGDGRTEETAGAARPSPWKDIPLELLGAARAAAGLRIEREGLTTRVEEVVLREIWTEAQVRAMDEEKSFADALAAILAAERELAARLEE